jgi:hypothetical protein
METITTLMPLQQAVESTVPDSQTRKRKIHCKQELIVMSLQTFYAARKDLPEIMELLQGTSIISLRLIDWFVTNYAKRHNIGYVMGGQEFNSKKLFDPFCRRERIMFSLPGTEQFVTTVGKLNFFRWAIEKNVIEYLKTNRVTVETEMNAHMKQLSRSRSTRNTTNSSTEDKKEEKVPKRVRTAFQTTPPQTLCRRDVEINVGFD